MNSSQGVPEARQQGVLTDFRPCQTVLGPVDFHFLGFLVLKKNWEVRGIMA